MTWAAFYIDSSGEGFSETCPDWTKAQSVLHELIDMINPPRSGISFHDVLKEATPERDFHSTDGVFQFAIEQVPLAQQCS